MELFEIQDFVNKVIVSGDIPSLDYSSYTIYKAHIVSIKQQKDSFGDKIEIASSDGQVFELNYQAFNSSYGFSNNTQLREHLESLIL